MRHDARRERRKEKRQPFPGNIDRWRAGGFPLSFKCTSAEIAVYFASLANQLRLVNRIPQICHSEFAGPMVQILKVELAGLNCEHTSRIVHLFLATAR